LKVGDQFLRRGEGVVAFLAAEVPMIAFTCFVVEPQNALAMYDIGEPVLERVIRSSTGFRYSPENQLGEGAFRINDSSTEKLYGLHVGDYANTWPCCQWLQHEREVSMRPKLISLLRAAVQHNTVA
jgi:hypothetical protein